MLHDPEHQWQYTEFLGAVLQGDYRCLRELVEGMSRLVLSDVAGLVSRGRGADPVVCFGIPSRDALEKRIGAPGVREVLSQQMTSVEETGLWYGRHEVELVNGGRQQDILFLRLPQLFDETLPEMALYLCFVDRLLRECPMFGLEHFHVEPLVSIARAWVTHVARNKTAIDWGCLRLRALADRNVDASELSALEVRLDQSRRMLSLREVIEIIDVLVTHGDSRRAGPAEIPTIVSNALGEDLSRWRNCVPPRWPPDCDGCEAGADVPRELAAWAFWRNCGPNAIVRDRRRLGEVPGRLLGSIAMSARKAVHPEQNLLPHGLLNFVLGRDADPWIAERMKFWDTRAPSDAEVAMALRSTARVAHFSLGGMPLDDKSIEAIVWLLAEYAHHCLGIPQQIDLRAHLLQAARGEPALHVLKDFYRDHFFHALEVCFLGHFLLETELPNGRTLWQLVAENLPPDNSPSDDHRRVLRLWYVASLLHDVGYGIDVLQGVHRLLRFFRRSPPLGVFLDRLSTDISRLSDDLRAAGLAMHAGAEKPGEDHGVVGAWHLEHLLDRASAKDPMIKPAVYWPAIRAIAMHNLRWQTVSFKEDPLAFLLVLCDTVQEWNRPQLGLSAAPSRLLSHLVSGQTVSPGAHGALDVVRIFLEHCSGRPAFRVPIGSDKLRFELHFNDEIGRNAGVFTLWLDATLNLQRLQGLPEGLEVEIEYCTPLFSKGNGATPELQLHRLRDAAQETHMTFLDRWFPEEESGAGLSGDGVNWTPGQPSATGTRVETLRLHLRRLNEVKPMTSGMDEFYEHLARWKRFNEDRAFAGDYAAPESAD